MSDLDLLHRKMRLIEKWMLLVDERLLVLERLKEPTIDNQLSLGKRVKKLEQEGSYFARAENIKEVQNLNG